MTDITVEHPPVFRDELSFRRYICDAFNERHAADPSLQAVDVVEPEQTDVEYVIRTGIVLSDGSQILAALDLRPLVALACAPTGTAH